MPVDITCGLRWPSINFSSIFNNVLRLVIGRKFVGSDRLNPDFFISGVTRPTLGDNGNKLKLKDRLSRCVISSAITSTVDFNKGNYIFDAIFVSARINFETSSSVTSGITPMIEGTCLLTGGRWYGGNAGSPNGFLTFDS